MNATYLFSVVPALRPGRVRHLVAAPRRRRWAARRVQATSPQGEFAGYFPFDQQYYI